jgi:protein-disulfide isomerase
MNLSTETKFLIGAGLATIILIVGGVFFFSSKDQKQPATLGAQADNSILLSNTKHTLGDPNAPVKIVEFADFQCPACGVAHPIVKNILEKNKDKVYFVFRHFPLPTHKNAKIAAQAAESAGEQGKFWEMYDRIFENQKEWSDSNKATEIFLRYASEINLNVDKFKEDLDKVKDPIEQDYADGSKVGVNSTPTFFINGQKYPGVISQSEFQQIIDKTGTTQ